MNIAGYWDGSPYKEWLAWLFFVFSGDTVFFLEESKLTVL